MEKPKKILYILFLLILFSGCTSSPRYLTNNTTYKTREKGILQFENFKKVIDEIKDYVLQLSLQNWGEATLVKDLPKMIKYASDNGIFTRLSTNFSVRYNDEFLEELMMSGLGIIVIDLDGTDQETYERYRKNGD